MKRYNLSAIMLRAWRNFRKNHDDNMSFSEALHRAWLSAKQEPVNASRIEAAKAAAGILEPVNTWSGWKEQGREVTHGSKAAFRAVLLWGSKGDGATYTAAFFTESQTAPIAAA